MEAEESKNADRRQSSRPKGKKKPIYVFPELERPMPKLTKSVAKKRAKIDLEMIQKADTSAVETFVENEGSSSGKSIYLKMKETLRVFNSHYLHFVQQEELRIKEHEIKLKKMPLIKKKKISKSATEEGGGKVMKVSKKKDSGLEDELKRACKRPDLKASSLMKKSGSYLYPKKRIGHLPGIDVGQQFFSRTEMVVLGLHHHWLAGIDYMGISESKKKSEIPKNLPLPLAVSVVLSGMYEDDSDNKDEVIYTGQGGQDLLGSKQQISDQKLERGNLALKNNYECGQPVRFIRGHDLPSSYTGKVYTYDGLYKVTDYWAEKGVSGFTVYKYRLNRLDDQPALTTSEVLFIRSKGRQLISNLRGLVTSDISEGQEQIPIPVTNVIDDSPLALNGSVYRKSLKVPEDLKVTENAAGCNCKGGCTDPTICACAKLNGSGFPYVRKDGGRIMIAKSVVFECGANCSCSSECINRVSQQGIRYHLEIFRTQNKGWGVRSWDFIPSGAPICEYTGNLMKTDEIENASANDYIFDIDCLQTMKGLDSRDRRPGEDLSLGLQKLEPEYCIDAGKVGNVARFINHSCAPNLFVQCILTSHHDIMRAKVMLFAADNIPALEELTYDYGYVQDSVYGPDGNPVKKRCYCGTADCRRFLY